MKMYLPLVASEDGVVQLIKQPGVSLEPSDILGILTLDDPTRVKHAKPFEVLLPNMDTPANKPNQRFVRCLTVLNDIPDGFDNQAIMVSTVKDLISVLHDPELPCTEIKDILASLTGRIPAKLDNSIHASLEATKAKGDGKDFQLP